MSSTDGEDTRRTHSEEEKFAFRDGWLARHKKVIDLEKELSSLREQLKEKDEIIDSLNKAMIQGTELYANLRIDDELFTPYQLALQQLKQQEEVIRVLTAIIDEYITMSVVKDKNAYPYYLGEYKQIQDIVKKAKSLTTKDK